MIAREKLEAMLNQDPISVVEEKSLIFWDSPNRTQHFIREVSFQNKGQSFGFIVPVPSVPEVTDINNELIDFLNNEIEKKRPIKTRYHFPSMPRMPSFGEEGVMHSAAVNDMMDNEIKVVATFELNDYDVNVIQGSSSEGIIKWLSDNSLDYSKILGEYLNSYIKKSWYFVVFKFKKNESKLNSKSKFVRISFKTEKPFYPYDEAGQRSYSDRELKLYFVSNAPYAPDFTLENEISSPEGWEKVPLFSDWINPGQDIKKLIGAEKAWLVQWKDITSTRPSRDLVFVRTDEKVIVPEPRFDDIYITKGEIFIVVFFLLTCLVIIKLTLKLMRRGKSKSSK